MMADSKATISQIKSIYGRLVYTHKSYEKLYDFTISCGNWLKFLQIFFSAITTVGLVTILIQTQKWIEITTAVISALDLGITLFMKEFDLASKAKAYGDTANSLVPIRNACESLIVDYYDQNLDVLTLAARRDEILSKQDVILGNSLKTNSWGYRLASKALKINQEMTFENDEEIDQFLPVSIRGESSVSAE